MTFEFTLCLDNATVMGHHYDYVSIRWQQDLLLDEVLEISHKWISSKHFLTRRMVGLTHVGESSLTIEPFDEVPDIRI